MTQPATRRRFLYLVALASGGGLLAACSQAAPPAAAPTSAPPAAAPKPPTPPAAGAASPSPAASPAAAPSVSPAVVASPSPASSTAPSAGGAPAAAGQPGGTLRTTLGAEPGSLDPARSNTLFDADVHDSMFEGLFSNRVYDPITGALADSWNTPMGQLFQANMADVGIKVELIPQDINTWIDDAQNHYNFQLALTGVTPGPDPDTILTQLYDPNQANGKMTFYSNDMLNNLILQGRATVN
ncbi:MAG: hypothetical protein JOZ87_24025 [Chloroflexi bacterium]|nr:hypothetical protein [Chloroflexota bacterium]